MKNLILLVVTVFMLAGCTAHKEAAEKQARYDRKVEQAKEAQRVIDALEASKKETVQEEVIIKKKKVKKVKKLKGTYYRMITKSIEVFAYRGSLKNTNIINDKKLSKPFYLKGNKIKVEKIYTSKIGDKYGKISGKSLLVSMDDLTDYKK